jgi:signal transduction histidine kinase/CheY-like chemotaxis protein
VAKKANIPLEEGSKVKNTFNRYAVLITFITSSLLLLFLLVFINSLVNFSIKTMEYNIERRLIAVSKRASLLVNAEELKQFNEPADMERPEYIALRHKLKAFAEEEDVMYVYFIREINGYLYYIIDNDFNEETRSGLDSDPSEISLTPGAETALAGTAVCSGLGNYTVGWDGLIYSFSPVYNSEGNVIALSGVDINDKRIMAVHNMYRFLFAIEILAAIAVFASGFFSLKKYRQEARRANEESMSKTIFLAHTSHEIRTPMNAIMGMTELALREYGKPNCLEYINEIRQASSNLLTIINDILDLSKIESGGLPIIPSPYDTGSLLNDVLNIIRMRIEDKPVKLITEITPDIPAVMTGDETRVKQVLLNLLTNAVKYTPSGSIVFSVSVQPMADNTIKLTFTIQDTGIGIRENDIPKLFSDFARIDQRRNKNIEGTGLGLVITKNLCMAMGGDVFVESEYGKGSTFRAVITQTFTDSRPLGELKKTVYSYEKKGQVQFTASSVRVLVVDDIAANLKVAEGLLKPYNLQIDTTISGKQAVELVQRNRYDLIFMDHMMPDMDGVEATAAIRGIEGEYFKSVPIIALTANAVSGMKAMFLEKGFSDFLSKPIEISKLNTIMSKWIAKDKRELGTNAENSLPKEKQNDIREMTINGLDVKQGLVMTGGEVSLYIEVLELFCKDSEIRLEKLRVSTDDEEGLKNFILNVHSLKSSAASIGASAVSAEAAALEKAGTSGDFSFINKNLNSFLGQLSSLIKNIRAVLS